MGWIPLERASLMRAIELNAVAVENNKTAFEWGCRAAHDWAAVEKLLNPGQVIAFTPRKKQTLADMVQSRVGFLTQYQDATYAEGYRTFVNQVQAAELKLVGGEKQELSQAVARYLFKLMAYKDEYEVARLQTSAAFEAKIATLFEGDYTLHHHLAPPLWAARNEKGELQKQKMGPWVRLAFKALAPLKFLRGGPLDVFGYTQERREERALVQDYQHAIEGLLPLLTADNRAAAVAFAQVPEHIRGYGHVKARHLTAARTVWDAQLAQFHAVGQSPVKRMA
jgi:indolepyruvate ferredoxin oxidoreductase